MEPDLLRDAVAARQAAWQKAKALLDTGCLSKDEWRQWDAWQHEIHALDARIGALQLAFGGQGEPVAPEAARKFDHEKWREVNRLLSGAAPPVTAVEAFPVADKGGVVDPLKLKREPLVLDPRWEWCDVHTFGDPLPLYVRGACRHLETVPVNLLLTGETVARICLTCDADWRT